MKTNLLFESHTIGPIALLGELTIQLRYVSLLKSILGTLLNILLLIILELSGKLFAGD